MEQPQPEPAAVPELAVPVPEAELLGDSHTQKSLTSSTEVNRFFSTFVCINSPSKYMLLSVPSYVTATWCHVSGSNLLSVPSNVISGTVLDSELGAPVVVGLGEGLGIAYINRRGIPGVGAGAAGAGPAGAAVVVVVAGAAVVVVVGGAVVVAVV
jgi:hypothetical protein